MSINTIEQDFMRRVAEKVRLSPDGRNRFRVLTPFQFEDGDQLVIVLKKVGDRWILSDEAHTYMHLSYEVEENSLRSGIRRKFIYNALTMFDVQEHNQELTRDVSDGRYGDALYDFVQALLKITDVSYLENPHVKSTFVDEFRMLLYETVPNPENRMFFNWHDQHRDPEKKYNVDCLITGMPEPIIAFALGNDNKTRDATIALYQFKEWGTSFRPMAIFKSPKAVGRKVGERFKEVCKDNFIGIDESATRIRQFFHTNVPVEATTPSLLLQTLPTKIAAA